LSRVEIFRKISRRISAITLSGFPRRLYNGESPFTLRLSSSASRREAAFRKARRGIQFSGLTASS
jgi:hypothetical protein